VSLRGPARDASERRPDGAAVVQLDGRDAVGEEPTIARAVHLEVSLGATEPPPHGVHLALATTTTAGAARVRKFLCGRSGRS
jgi:hypothetical protein